MNKQELRRRAQKVMKEFYGFAPSQKQIVLLEASGDYSSIMWQVGKFEYDWHAGREDRFGYWIGEHINIREVENYES